MHTKPILTVVCFSLAALTLFLTGYQFVRAQNYCHQIHSSAEFPNTRDFGVPYNVFDAGLPNMIKIVCNAPSSTAYIGYGQNNHYIFQEAYMWRGSNWERQGVSGPIKDRDWLVGEAIAAMNTSEADLGQRQWFVAYICHYVNEQWQCGCSDQNTCQNNRWSIQSFSGAPAGIPPPEISFTAIDGFQITAGTPVQMTWSAQNATGCTAFSDSGIAQWEGAVPVQGSRVINGITANERLQIQCVGPGGAATRLQQIFVQ